MGKNIKDGLILSVILSLTLHMISMTADQVDWNISIQFKALKESLQRIKDYKKQDNIGIKEESKLFKNETESETGGGYSNSKLLSNHEEKSLEKLDEPSLTQVITKELKNIKEGYEKNKKLRFSPDSNEWKEIDEALAKEQSNKKRTKGGLAKQIEFLDNAPKQPIKVSIIAAASSSSEDNMNIQLAKILQDCGEGSATYGGVGLAFQPSPLKANTLMVVQVATGYPADKAGIKNGDEFIGNSHLVLRGDIGTSVNANFVRNNTEFSVTMIREKVCYREK